MSDPDDYKRYDNAALLSAYVQAMDRAHNAPKASTGEGSSMAWARFSREAFGFRDEIVRRGLAVPDTTVT